MYGQTKSIFSIFRFKNHNQTIINYFNERLTDASAKSFNAKIKAFSVDIILLLRACFADATVFFTTSIQFFRLIPLPEPFLSHPAILIFASAQ
ncbi:hypothetical protein D0T57_14980 [Dysgonomonas sp. 511]|nr:hypothetical protein [Dysgonomonas sp. 511]